MILFRSSTIWILILLSSFTYGKQPDKNTLFSSATFAMHGKDQSPSEIRFKDGYETTIATFWQSYKNLFNLPANNKFKAFISSTDKLGQTHHRFKQYYKGLEVADMQYILHEKNGLVHLANGKMIHGLNINTIPALSEAQALQKALTQLGAESYMWENPLNEAYKRRFEDDKYATYYPKGELMISSAGNKADPKEFHLVYRFEIYAEKPSFAYKVDVDATTGKILNKILAEFYEGKVESIRFFIIREI